MAILLRRKLKNSHVQKIYIWDIGVRLSHWLVAILFFANYWFLDTGEWLHEWAGYLLASIIIARILWGTFSPGNANIAGLLPTPKTINGYVKLLFHTVNNQRALQNYHKKHSGHNPVGALMILFLWCSLLLTSITGWLQTTDKYWGEEWPATAHKISADAVMIAVCIHVMAVLITQVLCKQALIKPMLTGYRTGEQKDDAHSH